MSSATMSNVVARRSRSARGASIWAYLPLIVFVLITALPVYVMISVSLIPSKGLYTGLYHLWPAKAAFTNYLRMWSVFPLATYLRNSLIIVSSSTALSLLVGIPAGYALAKREFRGRRLWFFGLLASQMLPSTIIVVAAYRALAFLHGTDTFWGLIVLEGGFYGMPFVIWVVAGFMQNLPAEVEEAAMLDGCSRWRRLWRIIVPMSMPAIVVGAVFAAIASWNDFVFALTLATKTGVMPLTVGIYNFISPYQAKWNYLMGGSLVAAVPIVLFFLIVQRRIIGGFSAGAVR